MNYLSTQTMFLLDHLSQKEETLYTSHRNQPSASFIQYSLQNLGKLQRELKMANIVVVEIAGELYHPNIYSKKVKHNPVFIKK